MISGRPASVSCTGKRGYETRRAAKEAIKQMKAKGHKPSYLRDAKAKLTEYGCRYCGWWHIGHINSASWTGTILDPANMPDMMKLRQRPRLNGPIVVSSGR